MVNFSWEDAVYIKIDKELRNGTYVLSSDLLEKEQKAKEVFEHPSLLNFLLDFKNNIWFIIPLMLWLLIVNDGWILSLGLLVLYLFALFFVDKGRYGGVLFRVSIDFYNSAKPYDNTITEAKYLIKEIRKAEKIGGEEGLQMYYLLVEEMDQKYGKGQHLLAPPYDSRKEKREQDELKKQKALEQIRQWRKELNERRK